MKLNRLNQCLAVALVLVLAVLMFSRVDNSQPNYQVNLGDDMTTSPAYAAYEVNENFANGRTLQDPVPGTVVRGAKLYPFEATPQDALRAGEELTNPFDLVTEQGVASAKRGQDVYQVFCISCHAADGAGNGLVAQKGFPPPPSLLIGKSREMKDGQLFHILTFGQNSMPNFAAQLPPDRRWDVINYLRQLQQKTPPLDEAPPNTTTPDEEPEVTSDAEASPADPPEVDKPLEPNSEPNQ